MAIQGFDRYDQSAIDIEAYGGRKHDGWEDCGITYINRTSALRLKVSMFEKNIIFVR